MYRLNLDSSLSNIPRIFMKVHENQCINLPVLLSSISGSFAFRRAEQYHLSSINIGIHVNQTNSRGGIRPRCAHRDAPFCISPPAYDRYITILLIQRSIIRVLLVLSSAARHAHVPLHQIATYNMGSVFREIFQSHI